MLPFAVTYRRWLRRPPVRTDGRVLVVGNGMASHKLCERLTVPGSSRDLEITVIGEESVPAYDRVHLSDCFASRNPDDILLATADWYAERGIRLVIGDAVVSIDAPHRVARTRNGLELRYDHLVLATGSRPFMPPVPGMDLPGVFAYRTLRDLEAILAKARGCRTAAVVGGGLLGLEAARALKSGGLRVVIVENSKGLLSRQLNIEAAELVLRKIEGMGMEVLLQRSLASIAPVAGRLELAFAEGDPLGADMVVVAAGVRPRDELAATCGLKLGPKGGFVVDDFLRASVPGIYAIGECAVHRGVGYGLAAPGFRMAEHLAEALRGGMRPRPFTGADQSTTLKIMGMDVHILGEHLGEGSEVAWREGDRYRLLTMNSGRLIGAIAVGPWSEAELVREAALTRRRLRPWHVRRFHRGEPMWPSQGGPHPESWPEATLICHCNQVRKGAVCSAIRTGYGTLEAVRNATGASAVCGGCAPLVERLLGAPATPPQPSRMAPAALVALAGVATIALMPPLPVAESVGDAWHGVERLWRDGTWRQASGYTVLALAVLSLLLPLRKRFSRLQLGSVASWRLIHAALGIAGLAGLAVHTGFRVGHGMNLALATAFIGLNLFGALAGSAMARMEKSPSLASSAVRSALTRTHVLLLLPLPVLLLVHIWAVYLF